MLVSLIKQADMDEDNVLHQFLQFERAEACAILSALVNAMEDKHDRAQLVEVLQEAMEALNQVGESPSSRIQAYASKPGKQAIVASMTELQEVLAAVTADMSSRR